MANAKVSMWIFLSLASSAFFIVDLPTFLYRRDSRLILSMGYGDVAPDMGMRCRGVRQRMY